MGEESYDAFLSYNSEDRDAVETIARCLEDKVGLKPWLDRWHLIPGEPWFQNMERGLIVSKNMRGFRRKEWGRALAAEGSVRRAGPPGKRSPLSSRTRAAAGCVH